MDTTVRVTKEVNAALKKIAAIREITVKELLEKFSEEELDKAISELAKER